MGRRDVTRDHAVDRLPLALGATLCTLEPVESGHHADGLSWLGDRGRDGGVDRVPLPHAQGVLSLCGKHAIGPSPESVVERHGVTTVVCLVEQHELLDRYPRYVEWLRSDERHRRPGRSVETVEAVWEPIHDLHAPTLDRALALVDDVVARLHHGEHVLIHCGAGIGRAGTVATLVLIALGMDEDEALRHVAAHRPMAGPEVGAQQELVRNAALALSERA